MNSTTRVVTHIVLAGSMVVTSVAAQSYKVVKRATLGGGGTALDHLLVDPDARRLYITRETHVMVVDADSLQVVGDISGTPGVHSVLAVRELDRGFTTNSAADNLTVFDLDTLQPLGTIKVGGAPQWVLYDRSHKRLLTLNQRSRDLSVVDAVSGAATSSVPLDGSPGIALLDGRGHLLVTIPEKNMIEQVDLARLRVSARWPVAPGIRPVGLALDFANQHLFVSCSNRRMIVMDAGHGKVIATVAIGAGARGVRYDPDARMAFSANGGDGTLSIIREESPDRFSVVQNVATAPGARALTIDRKLHKLYTMAGTSSGARARAKGQRQFQLLVIGNTP